jgi:autotransporter-associated beta strand protein
MPTINQKSGSPVVISNELGLGADTTFGGLGIGWVTASGLVSGSGGLTKNSPGTLQLYGLVPNTYTGGTIVNNGTLHLGAYINGGSPLCANPAGTGPVTLNAGGTIQFDRVSASNALIVNGGTLHSSNGWGATWSGPITLNATLTCNASYILTLSNAISGTGGLTKTSNGPLILSGANSYSGNTTVNAGTLQLNSANAGNNASTVTIAASGATLNLNFSGTETVNRLFIGSTQMAPGIYKAVGSAATGTALAQLTGTGTLTVSIGPVSTTATIVTSDLNPALVGSPITFTSTVSGNAPTGNVTFYAGATLIGTSALNGSFQASVTTSSLAAGSYSVTASYAGNSSNSTSTSTGLNQVIALYTYESWASNPMHGLTAGVNNGPLDDPDKDGIRNLLEFALGGAPMISSQSNMPVISKLGGDWVFEYERSDLSLSPATVQIVEYGSNLTGWTPVSIPATSAGIVTITPGSPTDHVKVTIPAGGTQTFVRLKVSK